MVYVTFGFAVQRATQTKRWFVRPIAFTLTAFGAALVAGMALGAIGATVLTTGDRATAFSALGVAAILAGTSDLLGYALNVPQRDRETPRTWLRFPEWLAAALNGLALGLGWNTRIGFWLWYVVPLGCFFSGSVEAGAAIYGAYGLARGLGPWLVLGIDRIRNRVAERPRTNTAMWLIDRYHLMKRVAAIQLIIMGVVDVVILAF